MKMKWWDLFTDDYSLEEAFSRSSVSDGVGSSFSDCTECGFSFKKNKTIGHACPGRILMDLNKPEPVPKGTGSEVTPLVIKDLELRSKMGKEKYGETLRAFNGRNALVDAYQEALDLVQYLRQKLEEDALIAKARPTEKEDLLNVALPMMPVMEKSADDIFPDRTVTKSMGTGRLDCTKADLYARPGRVIYVNGPESIAQEAHRLVLGDRGVAYGHPIFDMTRSADMLTALLRDKLRAGARLEAEDIGQAMVCVKQSRQRFKSKRDNLTDTAGYALTLQMIAEWREQNPGVDPRDAFPPA